MVALYKPLYMFITSYWRFKMIDLIFKKIQEALLNLKQNKWVSLLQA